MRCSGSKTRRTVAARSFLHRSGSGEKQLIGEEEWKKISRAMITAWIREFLGMPRCGWLMRRGHEEDVGSVVMGGAQGISAGGSISSCGGRAVGLDGWRKEVRWV